MGASLPSLPSLHLRPGIHVAHSSSRYPREAELAGYIYTVCSKSINTALLSDVWPMGAAERLIAAGTEGELVASLQG